MRIVSTKGRTVRNCVAAARRLLGLELNSSREILRSGGEDGLYRVTLATEDVVEVTLSGDHGPTQAYLL